MTKRKKGFAATTIDRTVLLDVFFLIERVENHSGFSRNSSHQQQIATLNSETIARTSSSTWFLHQGGRLIGADV